VANIFTSIKANPLSVLNRADYDVIDYSTLKTALFRALYMPFPLLCEAAYALARLENVDGRVALAALKRYKEEPKCGSPPGPLLAYSTEAFLAVMYGEAVGAGHGISNITQHFEELSKISMFANVWTELTRMGCT
jgi:hypothetical protein